MRRLEEEASIERSIAISTIIGKADTAASSSAIGPWISLGNASWKGCCVRRGWSSSNMKGARASSWASSILDPPLTISIEGLPIFHGGESRSAGDHVPMSISNYQVIADRGWWVSRDLEEGGKKRWKSRLFEDLGDINGRNNYLRWRRGRKILSDSKRKWNNLVDNSLNEERERERECRFVDDFFFSNRITTLEGRRSSGIIWFEQKRWNERAWKSYRFYYVNNGESTT